MNDNFKKCTWLLRQLFNSPKNYQELNRSWKQQPWNPDCNDLPRRTLQNYIDNIEEMFDIIIENENKGHYNYSIKDSDVIIDNFTSNIIFYYYCVKNFIDENKSLKNAIFDMDLSKPFPKHLPSVLNAIEQRSILFVDLINDKGDIIKIPVFKPTKIVKADNKWFVVGTDENGIEKIYDIKDIYDIRVMGKVLETEKQDNDAKQYVMNCLANKRSDRFELMTQNDDTLEFISCIEKAYSFLEK